MDQKFGDISDQMDEMLALECSVDDVETLNEVFHQSQKSKMHFSVWFV